MRTWCLGWTAATNSTDWGVPVGLENLIGTEASFSAQRLSGLRFTIRTPQPNGPPLNGLSVRNRSSQAHIQGSLMYPERHERRDLLWLLI